MNDGKKPMRSTRIVEDGVRAYASPAAEPAHNRLVRKGPLLVMTGGRRVTSAETDAAIMAARLGERGA